MTEPRYISGSDLEPGLDSWGLVRLRLKEHEYMIVAEAGDDEHPGSFITRNRLLEAISAYAGTKS